MNTATPKNRLATPQFLQITLIKKEICKPCKMNFYFCKSIFLRFTLNITYGLALAEEEKEERSEVCGQSVMV